MSALALTAVICLISLTDGHWAPWFCPTLAAVFGFAFVVLERRSMRG